MLVPTEASTDIYDNIATLYRVNIQGATTEIWNVKSNHNTIYSSKNDKKNIRAIACDALVAPGSVMLTVPTPGPDIV